MMFDITSAVKKNYLNNENGFVLVASLLILMILVIIGIAAITTTTTELQIAGNEKVHKQTFYKADGGTELGIRITFENALCINEDGFQNPGSDVYIGNILIPQSELSFATPGTGGTLTYFTDTLDNDPKTELSVSGVTVVSPGSGLQMVAGYEGLGKGAAGGGTHLLYDIVSKHSGLRNSESEVQIQWRLGSHLINNASSSDCDY